MLVKHGKTIKTTATPLAVSVFDNELIMVDSAYIFYRFDSSDFSLIEAKRISTKYEPHHNLYRGFHAAGPYITVTFSGKNTIFLLNAQGKLENVGSSGWHAAQVESSFVSVENNYFLSGGQDGKIYIHDLQSARMIGSLPQKPDYIATITVGQSSNLIGSSSFNKTVTVYDLDKGLVLAEFKTEEVAQNLLFFDNDRYLFAACRDGNGMVFDIHEQKLLSTTHYFNEWPTAITYSKDHRHAIVGTRNGYLYAIDLAKNSKRFNVKIREIGISNLYINDQHLLVSYVDGVNEVYDLNVGEEAIKRHIEEQNYTAAREELNSNILLFLHPVIALFDTAWESALEAAKTALLVDDLGRASLIVSPFLFDENKKQQFHALIGDLENVAEFKDAFERKDYTKAYELAEKEPLLKQFSIYKEMEDRWEKVISAIKMLIQNDLEANKPKCTALLRPYITVPEKRHIAQNIMNNAHAFIQAENAVAVKDYGEYYRLAAKRPFLKETPMYQKLGALALRILEKVNDLLKHEEYAEVVKLAKASLHFAPIEADLKAVIQEVSGRLKFIAAIKANDLHTVYELLGQYDTFSYLQEYVAMDKAFKQLVRQGMEYAQRGESEAVYNLISIYLEIPYRMDKAAQVMKVSFLNELRLAVRMDEQVDWIKSFRRYAELFSKDADIKQLAQLINKSKALEHVPELTDMEFGYRKKEVPASIIVERDA